ncbi:tetratricopeptide repeat protein [Nonomuraea ferruginea]
MPYLTESDQNLLTQLMDLSSPVPRRASARAAIHALTAAPSPEPPLLHGDSLALLHLLRAEIARALGLDLADQVSCFRRAARVFTPGSGPTAMKIGQLALSCTLADPETQPVRLQKALVEARRIAVRYRPDDVVAHLNFGYLLYDLGRFAEAEGVYRTAVRIDPDYAVAYNGLGNVLHALGRFAEAEDAYREAIRIDPDYAFAHNGLGNLLYDLGRFTETEDAYREAIRIDPDYAFAHNGLGNVLYGLGRFTEAEDAYREAIRADPYYAFAHNGLGIMLKEQGRYTEAERAHRRAIESDPGYAIAHGWLGLLLMCVGEFERARLELEQADARPRSELSRWILDRAHPPSGASVHTPDSVHAAFDEPPAASNGSSVDVHDGRDPRAGHGLAKATGRGLWRSSGPWWTSAAPAIGSYGLCMTCWPAPSRSPGWSSYWMCGGRSSRRIRRRWARGAARIRPDPSIHAAAYGFLTSILLKY